MVFTFIVRHGGWFGTSPYCHYFGGGRSVFPDQDEDRWSYIDTVDMIKELGYKEFNLWWSYIDTTEDVPKEVFRPYKSDSDALEMATIAASKGEGVLFVENLSKEPLSMHVRNFEPIVPSVVNEKEKARKKKAQPTKMKTVRRSHRLQAVVRKSNNLGKPSLVVISDDEDLHGEVTLHSQFPIDENVPENGIAPDVTVSESLQVAENVPENLSAPMAPAVDEIVPEVQVVPENVPEVQVVPENLVESDNNIPKVIDGDDDQSDVSNQGIRLEDSEEERDLQQEDELTNPAFAEAEDLLNKHITQMLNGRSADGMGMAFGDDPDFDGGYESEDLESVATDSEMEDVPRRRYPKFVEERLGPDFKFILGMDFASLDQFKEALTDVCVTNGREYKFLKNDSIRCRVACRSDDCPWLILCSKVGNKKSYRIKTLVDNHTCARVFDNKSANIKWVKKKLLNTVRTVNKISTNEIVDDFRVNLGTGITRYRAWKGKQLATEEVEGAVELQYTLLWRFSNELRARSAGNTCKMSFESPRTTLFPRFSRYYMCLDGCKRGFLAGCRPFIGLDGCHLKTKHGGILLAAVGRDANEQYFPLAFAVVESETKDSWRWFMELLMDDIDPTRSSRWVFISDQQKVIVILLS